MLTIRIDQLQPFQPHLHGSSIGEAHAVQVRDLIFHYCDRQPNHVFDSTNDSMVVANCSNGEPESVIVDFQGVRGATASYLKQLINPFFLPSSDPASFPQQLAPVLINVESPDLKLEIDDFLAGKGRVLILADRADETPRFNQMLGRLEGVAAETFQELQAMKKTTAAELYERHRKETTNQTVWNHRLLQLVELRVARRNRDGRFWIYEPTVQL